ncbi:MAG: translation initiation factor IF-2 [Gemmatimonas sp.]
MSKLRVHDMAGEFGISADEVIALLRTMDVPVRSHLSLLTDDQVSRIRARWEREKRVRAEKAQPQPVVAPRRRRTGAAAAPEAPEPVAEPEQAAAPKVGRRRAAAPSDVGAESAPHDAPPVAAEAPAAPEAPAKPAPEVPAAKPEPVVEAKSAEPAAVEPPKAAEVAAADEARRPAPAPVAPKPARAATPAPEAPAAPVAEVPKAVPAEKPAAAADAPEAPKPAEPKAPAAPVASTATPTPAAPVAAVSGTPATGTPVVGTPATGTPAVPPASPTSSLPPDRQRPRPIVPGAPRPRPVASAAPTFGNARPIASAAPGGGMSQGQRRDDRGGQQNRPGGQGGQGGQGGGQGGGQQNNQNNQQNAASAQNQPRRGKKGKRGAVDQEAVSANITKTMTALRGAPTRGRGGDRRFGADRRAEAEEQRQAAVEREKKTVRVNEFITVSELAQIIGIPATQIVGFAFKTLGLMVTINQRLDFDQIELIAGEFGFQAVKESDYAADLTEGKEKDAEEDLRPRPPVVTIMGHVDHGKTSLLDYIRKANVVAGEAGGITQHIGAYHVSLPNGRTITFLDTPGHEAFTAMRARGAQVTDIVVLVVAADDRVMPQTIEAISHAKSAGVPMIVAINKIDLPDANPDMVRQDLLQHEVVLEEYGGTTLSTAISAKKGTGVDDLLEQILLQADILELKANPARQAIGTVVEAQLDQGKGPVATILVKNGTLKVGDDYICGIYSGKVRALHDERGKEVKSAGPAIPVRLLGLSGVPMAGDELTVVSDSSAAREIAQRRERLDREAKSRRTNRGSISLEDFMSKTAEGQKRQLRLVIKADQGGPAEALADSLGHLSNNEVTVEIIHRGVGAISESDIQLAKASGSIIIGFHVRPDNNARSAAEREGVEIRLYRIIYEAVADMKSALEGMLRPESREVVYGEAEVREVFKVARIGTIAGCSVRSGNISKKGRIRVIRDGVELYDGAIASLRRFKDDVQEVKEGYECGIGVENFNDLKIGDVLECYRTEEVARTLDQTSRS